MNIKTINGSQIRYLERHEINDKKWDACVNNSITPLVYGLTWYLDNCCEKWDGIILGNYDTIMPVPLKNKFGFQLALTPYFIQKLGIFSSNPITQKTVNSFYNLVPAKFFFINTVSNYIPKITLKKITLCPDYELLLDRPYESIYRNYSSHSKYNVRRSLKEKLKFESTNDIEWFKTFANKYRRFYLPEKEKASLGQILKSAFEKGCGHIVISKNLENQINAAIFLIIYNNTIYYHSPISTPEGYTQRALYFLLDSIIKKYSNSGYIIDFEGSKIDNIARFFKGFGGTLNYYTQLSMIKLY
ncbi:hypothetical protein DMA11_02580 [Marinilabiliaceae bacterium JC017]|nr:hypothetical protein DMA11_02580 [Marinilabiliaceae bacterium JC017]